VEFGSLVALELDDADWVRRLDIVYRRTKPFTTAITRFLELLHQDPDTFSNSVESPKVTDAIALAAKSPSSPAPMPR
jgi:hypothetical protein